MILIVYWALLSLVPVPGGVAPNLEKETSLAAWLDRALLTENHLWKLSRTWDPEGILSTLPAIASGISGTLTGVWLRRKDIELNKKILVLLLAGIISLIAGLTWSLSFPLNLLYETNTAFIAINGIAGKCPAKSHFIHHHFFTTES